MEVYAQEIGTLCNVHSGHESGQWEVYTLDRNQDSVKRTLRTEIRTMGSARSGNRNSVQCTFGTRIRTVGNVHSRQESGQWEMYTQDRNRDSVQCTLRTGIKTVGSVHSGNRDSAQSTPRTGLGTVGNVHPGQESRQVGVYNQRGIRTVCSVHSYWEVYTHDRNRDSAVGRVHPGGESGQCAVQNQDCNTMYTKDRKRDNVPCTRMT